MKKTGGIYDGFGKKQDAAYISEFERVFDRELEKYLTGEADGRK